MVRTPRAWTDDFPTEIFRKRAVDERTTEANRAFEAAYTLGLRDLEKSKQTDDLLAAHRTELTNLGMQVHNLEAMLAESSEDLRQRQAAMDQLANENDHRQTVIDELAVEAQHRLDVIEGLIRERDALLHQAGDLRQRIAELEELAQRSLLARLMSAYRMRRHGKHS